MLLQSRSLYEGLRRRIARTPYRISSLPKVCRGCSLVGSGSSTTASVCASAFFPRGDRMNSWGWVVRLVSIAPCWSPSLPSSDGGSCRVGRGGCIEGAVGRELELAEGPLPCPASPKRSNMPRPPKFVLPAGGWALELLLPLPGWFWFPAGGASSSGSDGCRLPALRPGPPPPGPPSPPPPGGLVQVRDLLLPVLFRSTSWWRW
jgi:hypothetical protein